MNFSAKEFYPCSALVSQGNKLQIHHAQKNRQGEKKIEEEREEEEEEEQSMQPSIQRDKLKILQTEKERER